MENDFAALKDFGDYTVGELVNNLLMTCAFVCDVRKDIKELKEKKIGKDFIANGQKTYEQGLEDAWLAVKFLMKPRSQYSWNKICELFDVRFGSEIDDIILSTSPSEAIQKIREYEEKQKKSCSTCFYGDKHDGDTNVYCNYNCVDEKHSGWQPKECNKDKAESEE